MSNITIRGGKRSQGSGNRIIGSMVLWRVFVVLGCAFSALGMLVHGVEHNAPGNYIFAALGAAGSWKLLKNIGRF